MAVSVRMDPLLESELAQAAKRRGISKSQFIVEAVERALGRNNPGELYLKVMQEMANYTVTAPVDAETLSPNKAAIRQILRTKHAQEQTDYAEFLKVQATQTGGAV